LCHDTEAASILAIGDLLKEVKGELPAAAHPKFDRFVEKRVDVAGGVVSVIVANMQGKLDSYPPAMYAIVLPALSQSA
jgi:hypothetical protein